MTAPDINPMGGKVDNLQHFERSKAESFLVPAGAPGPRVTNVEQGVQAGSYFKGKTFSSVVKGIARVFAVGVGFSAYSIGVVGCAAIAIPSFITSGFLGIFTWGVGRILKKEHNDLFNSFALPFKVITPITTLIRIPLIGLSLLGASCLHFGLGNETKNFKLQSANLDIDLLESALTKNWGSNSGEGELEPETNPLRLAIQFLLEKIKGKNSSQGKIEHDQTKKETDVD